MVHYHFVGRCHDYKTSFVIWKEKNFMLLFQALLGFPLKLFVPSFKGAFHRVTASGWVLEEACWLCSHSSLEHGSRGLLALCAAGILERPTSLIYCSFGERKSILLGFLFWDTSNSLWKQFFLLHRFLSGSSIYIFSAPAPPPVLFLKYI